MLTGVLIEKLIKCYGSSTVVDNIFLDILPGEFVSLLGPSGCGKTTVLRMIAGLEKPSMGRILMNKDPVFDGDKHVNIPPEKRMLGMVFQNYAIWPHMTVLENVSFGLRCQGVSRSERSIAAMEWLRKVKMADLAERKPNQLSGGQQQRVALARALASKPRVLLMDEPLSNLDANLREEMVNEFLAIKKETPLTVIYVTHDHQEAIRLSDRIALMNAGKVEQFDGVNAILRKPANDFVKKFLRI